MLKGRRKRDKWKINSFNTRLIVRYVGMIVDDLFLGSLGLPRWRTCQIPDPGAATKCQYPYSREGSLYQILVGSPPPPPHPGA